MTLIIKWCYKTISTFDFLAGTVLIHHEYLKLALQVSWVDFSAYCM